MPFRLCASMQSKLPLVHSHLSSSGGSSSTLTLASVVQSGFRRPISTVRQFVCGICVVAIVVHVRCDSLGSQCLSDLHITTAPLCPLGKYYEQMLLKGVPEPHQFYHHNAGALRRPMYCNVCEHNLQSSDDGLCCDICGYATHTSCLENVEHNCKPVCADLASDADREQELLYGSASPVDSKAAPQSSSSSCAISQNHRWMRANHSIHDICIVCKEGIGSLFALSGLHCIWCQSKIHETCLSKGISRGALDSRCNLGMIGRLIIPPQCVKPAPGYTAATARLAMRKLLQGKIKEAADLRTPGVNGWYPSNYRRQSVAMRSTGSSTSTASTTTGPKNNAHAIEQVNPWLFTNIPSDVSPLLVVVNRKSGGNLGARLIHDFLERLNPIQVCDLAEGGGPLPFLKVFENVPRAQVLVCGGDGTVSWTLACVDQLKSVLPVALMPLGTGNDLAQVLGWGSGPSYSVHDYLSLIVGAKTVLLDRWNADVRPLSPNADAPESVEPIREAGCKPSAMSRPFGENHMVVNNYLGIGVDAIIAHNFHNMRDSYPHLFSSQLINKMWYARIGSETYFTQQADPLRTAKVRIFVDEKEVDLTGMEGICFLNIKSFGGGKDFWGRHEEGSQFMEPRMDDGYFEVIGFRSTLHMGQIRIGIAQADRLAQGRRAVIRTEGPLAFQVDGEPWGVKRNCEVVVTHRCQSFMLAPTTDEKEESIVQTVYDVLNWAEHTSLVSPRQRFAILAEFSRRYSRIAPASSFYAPLSAEQRDQEHSLPPAQQVQGALILASPGKDPGRSRSARRASPKSVPELLPRRIPSRAKRPTSIINLQGEEEEEEERALKSSDSSDDELDKAEQRTETLARKRLEHPSSRRNILSNTVKQINVAVRTSSRPRR